MKTIEQMEQYAKENYIPIARKDFIEYFKKLVSTNSFNHILEIGSAIGYSAINLALLENVYVTSIEHNEKLYNLFLENINDFNLNNKIKPILADALEVDIKEKFDVIFIDAAKAKNIRFFEKFKDNLKENGYIIIDNMNMDDFRKHASPKKIKFYDQKLVELRQFLDNLKEYEVKYLLDIGDGIALISRK